MSVKLSRTFGNIFSFAITLFVIAVIAAGYWVNTQYIQKGPLAAPQTFVIERGQTSQTIANNLYAAGAIHSPMAFVLGAKFLDNDDFLKAGEYQLEAGMSARTIVRLLQSGKTLSYQFTIPEGLTSAEIVALLNGLDLMSGTITKNPPEGSIYPDTYSYVRGEDRQATIERMQKEMNVFLDTIWTSRAPDTPFKTPQEAIIMASIIEKETGKPEERERVAGLFINRLKTEMRLQSDPTVIYAVTDGHPQSEGQGPLGRRLLKKDLEFDSPYNTYLYAGLPPTPICNPGAKSIIAALTPEKHDFIYMVADGTGGHAFAKSLREHNDNVAKWRNIRGQQEIKTAPPVPSPAIPPVTSPAPNTAE